MEFINNCHSEFSEVNAVASRSWLLTLLRDHVQYAPIATFVKLFIPLIQNLESRRMFSLDIVELKQLQLI